MHRVTGRHLLPGLVNSHITMENHHFGWVNQLFQWAFSSSQTVSLPEGTVINHR